MVLLKSFGKASAALAAGALSVFLFTTPSLHAEGLADALLKEGCFKQARMEALRNIASDKTDYASQLIALKAARHLGLDCRPEFEAFVENEEINQELRCDAHFELAGMLEADNQHEQALIHLTKCFNKTSSNKLFAAATQEAGRILSRNPELQKEHQELLSIIGTASATWSRTKFSKNYSPSLLSYPALWVIALYRTQIGPAIGARCSLHPSCSSYAIEALRTHGIVGLGIAGDRMVREPDVVAARKKTVVISNQIKIADPVTDHTFWMKEKEK